MGLIRMGVSPSDLSADSAERLNSNGVGILAVYVELSAVPNMPNAVACLM